MNKKTFMEELKRRLKHLPKEDLEDAIAYYEEYLMDMTMEENADITKVIGSPKDVAREIIMNCTEKHMDTQREQGGVKNSANIIWLIILGIAAAPFAIPFVIMILVLFFAVLIIAIVLILSVVLLGASFFAAGIVSIVTAFFATGMAQGMICIGIGLVGVSLGMLLLITSISSLQPMINGVANLFNKLLLRKKVA